MAPPLRPSANSQVTLHHVTLRSLAFSHGLTESFPTSYTMYIHAPEWSIEHVSSVSSQHGSFSLLPHFVIYSDKFPGVGGTQWARRHWEFWITSPPRSGDLTVHRILIDML